MAIIRASGERAKRTARSRLDSVPLRNFCAHVDRTSGRADPEPTRFLDQSLAQTWVTEHETRPFLCHCDCAGHNRLRLVSEWRSLTNRPLRVFIAPAKNGGKNRLKKLPKKNSLEKLAFGFELRLLLGCPDVGSMKPHRPGLGVSSRVALPAPRPSLSTSTIRIMLPPAAPGGLVPGPGPGGHWLLAPGI